MSGPRRTPRVSIAAGALWILVAASPSRSPAQTPPYDYSVLRINEVIVLNKTQDPETRDKRHVDMVEIYNAGDVTLPLGTDAIETTLGLSDRESPTLFEIWFFPAGSANIPPKGFLIVFLDGEPANVQDCDLYTGTSLKSDGTEPITLVGPAGQDGKRPILDRVWIPPLPEDVSFGRYPDGAGPTAISKEDAGKDETLQHFRFYPPGQTTFGSCKSCNAALGGIACTGLPNGEGGNLPPRVNRTGYSTNSPAAGTEVAFRVRVRDEKKPIPPDIAAVSIRYSVGGVAQPDIPMVYDEVLGLQSGVGEVPPNPLDFWTEWTGAIPGQPAGSVVEFRFEVRDSGDLTATDPEVLCAPGIGPCDREFGGPDCQIDEDDETCEEPPPSLKGARYIACSAPFRYVCGYEVPTALAALVVNEIVPRQDGLLQDPTEPSCNVDDQCPLNNPDCCKLREDFIELYNGSSTETADLSGLWLSDSPFRPRGWQFPPGSSIGPGEYLIVWLDDDGGKCPDPAAFNPPCFWECPDPTDPSRKWFHASFSLDADSDNLFLYDTEERRQGLIHGVSFELVELNHSVSLLPNGDRDGDWEVVDTPTPGASNAVYFLRGDADGNCSVNLTDAVYVLNHLFKGGGASGCADAADVDDNQVLEITDPIFLLNFLFLSGPEPASPGAVTPGPDPTQDLLGACVLACG